MNNDRILSCILILPDITISDDPCDDSDTEVAEFTSSLPLLAPEDLCRGKFTIKDGDSHFLISYLAREKIVLQRFFSKEEIDKVTPIVVGGGRSALFINYAYGAGGRIECSHLVVPAQQANRFLSIRMETPVRVRDIDSDNETEMITAEWQDWSLDCSLSMAEVPYWHRIFHLSPQTGKLIEVSEQFPQYYANLADNFSKLYSEVSSRQKLSQQCHQQFQLLIEKAKNFVTTRDNPKSRK